MARAEMGAETIDPIRRRLLYLRWSMTFVPALVVFVYETVRHDILEPILHLSYGNLLAGLVTLCVAYGFSRAIFGIVDRLYAQLLAGVQEAAILQATIDERERLSRELHDGFAQLVSTLLTRLDIVAELVGAGRRTEALTEVARLRALTDELYIEIRETISGLRSDVQQKGFVRALRDYLERFEELHGLRVTLQADPIADVLPLPTAVTLFRIAQEALSNVRKHAEASRVLVRVTPSASGRLALTISDDGRGLAQLPTADQPNRTQGLAVMRERAECLGGTFRIESEPGRGTIVTVEIPLDRQTKE